LHTRSSIIKQGTGRTQQIPGEVAVAKLKVLAAEEEDISPTAEGGLYDLNQCDESER
jgi:hypothetical protein